MKNLQINKCIANNCDKDIAIKKRQLCGIHYKRFMKYRDCNYYPQVNGDFRKNVTKALKKAWEDGKYDSRITKGFPGWNRNTANNIDKKHYKKVHGWIYKQLGKPSTCENCKKTNLIGVQIHWANISQKYLYELSDWKRLCSKCHSQFDTRLIKERLT